MKISTSLYNTKRSRIIKFAIKGRIVRGFSIMRKKIGYKKVFVGNKGGEPVYWRTLYFWPHWEISFFKGKKTTTYRTHVQRKMWHRVYRNQQQQAATLTSQMLEALYRGIYR